MDRIWSFLDCCVVKDKEGKITPIKDILKPSEVEIIKIADELGISEIYTVSKTRRYGTQMQLHPDIERELMKRKNKSNEY